MNALSAERNPFLLMLQPELVLAAVEKSEKLGRLNRHLCRPLDRPAMQPPGSADGSRSRTSLADDGDDDEV
ncbi:MAG: hypothetical protein ACOVOT_00620 [Rubrivivax sp.]|jgi:hypothetical protein|nr:hypothetical protein [Rubrivivax sp.]